MSMPLPRQDATPITDTEAYQTFLVRAKRQTVGLTPERLVAHILAVTRDGDWLWRTGRPAPNSPAKA